MVVADVDGTLLGDDDELDHLLKALAERSIILVPNSSRPLASLNRSWDLAGRDGFPAQVGALGTEVEIGGVITDWSACFGSFDRQPIDLVLAGMGYQTNGDEFQTNLKASYSIPRDQWDAARMAIEEVVPVQVITSGATDFDVIPVGAGKPAPLQHLARSLGVDPKRMVGAGDSMNDLSLLMAAPHRIVVGNADPDLVEHTRGHAIHSRALYAGGVREGLAKLGVLA